MITKPRAEPVWSCISPGRSCCSSRRLVPSCAGRWPCKQRCDLHAAHVEQLLHQPRKLCEESLESTGSRTDDRQFASLSFQCYSASRRRGPWVHPGRGAQEAQAVNASRGQSALRRERAERKRCSSPFHKHLRGPCAFSAGPLP